MINRINAMNEPLHPYKLNNVLGGYLDQKFSLRCHVFTQESGPVYVAKIGASRSTS